MEKSFKCYTCKRLFTHHVARCQGCGGLVEVCYAGELKWRIDQADASIWRYRSMLPRAEDIVSLGEGYTPIRKISGILVKDETKNPTGSYVDRGSSVLASVLDEGPRPINLCFKPDVTLSVSAYLSRRGVEVKVHVDPETGCVPELLHLASISVPIEFGQSEDDIVYGDPFMLEGFKTISYEILEQVGAPKGVIVPAEKGVLAFSILRGFETLLNLGVAKDLPQVVVATTDSYVEGLVKLLEKSGKVTVEESGSREVLSSMLELAKRGLYVKPLSAAAYEVAKRYGGDHIAVLTGSEFGKVLKAPKSSRPAATDLQKRILGVFKGRRGARLTAYQVWRLIGGSCSLQGVYRALRSLEASKLIEGSSAMVGKRKILTYRIKP